MIASKPLSITLVGVALAASPFAAGAQTGISVSTQNPIYVNGGIGEDEADAMRGRAAEFPLRLVFAEGPQNWFTANVPLAIVDERGNPVFALRDAGPMLYIRLPTGRYTVIAESGGLRKTQQVTLDRGRGRDVVFHWNTTTSTLDSM